MPGVYIKTSGSENTSPASTDAVMLDDGISTTWTTLANLIKGAIAPSTSGNFLVSNGTTWASTKIYNDYICIWDQKNANTAGGTFTSGAWRTRDLNTEHSDVGGHASVASNQITLVAGTYVCRISAPAYACGAHKSLLYNVTDSADILVSTSEYGPVGADADQNPSFISGKFTLAAQKVLEVRHRCAITQATNGFGVPANLDSKVEIYTIVELWRVA